MEENRFFNEMLEKTMSIPGAQIDRTRFLERNFKRRYPSKIKMIIEVGPIKAGVSKEEVDKIAKEISKKTNFDTSFISFITGIPGGIMAIPGMTFDAVQYFTACIVYVQKIMYLYGWEEDVFDHSDEIDESTMAALTLFIGLMFGVKGVGTVVSKIVTKTGIPMLKKTMFKSLLHKGPFRKIVATIVNKIGIIASIKFGTKGVQKIVPYVSGVISASFTAISFEQGSRNLLKNISEQNNSSSKADDNSDLEGIEIDDKLLEQVLEES